MHDRLLPPVLALAGTLCADTRVLDVGCGNGFFAGEFLGRGCKVVGIDLSESGLEIARRSHPTGRFERFAADEHLLENLAEDPFDIVLSTEVIEHLYSPWDFVDGCFQALKPGGRFICSTPYHGYLKNFALSLAGAWDKHLQPLNDGGHIKFWSKATLGRLLSETGFQETQFRGVGRLPFLWMSMVATATRPSSTSSHVSGSSD